VALVSLPDEDVVGLVHLELIGNRGTLSFLDAVVRPEGLVQTVCDDLEST